MYRFFERLLCGTDKTVLAPVGQRRALRGGRFGTERRKKRRRTRGREAHTPHRSALAVSPPPTFFKRNSAEAFHRLTLGEVAIPRMLLFKPPFNESI